jgi:hypothetical protein
VRLPPHTIWLMTLRGRKSLRGRPFPSKEEARLQLKRLTGEDFGLDAEKWSEWIKTHRKGLYTRGQRPEGA